MGSIFEGTKNIHGDLPPLAKQRILKFIDSPTQESWSAVASILVRPLTTLWQAVCMVDKTFPKKVERGEPKVWARIPDAMTVTRAIRHVVEKAKKEPPKVRPNLFEIEDEEAFLDRLSECNVVELNTYVDQTLAKELDNLVDSE